MSGNFFVKIDDTREELKSIRSWINNGNQFDSKTRYLVSYAVIKACGTVEVIFKTLIYDYLCENANEGAKNYFEKAILESSCNPSTGNMGNILQNISGHWKKTFDKRVKESGEKDKLNSLVQLRNDFAHGDSIGVSVDTVINYFESAIKILIILDEVISDIDSNSKNKN